MAKAIELRGLIKKYARPDISQSGSRYRTAKRLAEDKRVRIAVATDGSAFAQLATAFAGDLARAIDLIVVGSQTGAVQSQYWIGSVADGVARHAHRSVRVVQTTRQ